MGRTLRPQVALYLDPEKVEALAKLAEKTGRTKQDLLREGVDNLLNDAKQRVLNEVRKMKAVDVAALVKEGKLIPARPAGWYWLRDLSVLAEVAPIVNGVTQVERSKAGSTSLRHKVKLESAKKVRELARKFRV